MNYKYNFYIKTVKEHNTIINIKDDYTLECEIDAFANNYRWFRDYCIANQSSRWNNIGLKEEKAMSIFSLKFPKYTFYIDTINLDSIYLGDEAHVVKFNNGKVTHGKATIAYNYYFETDKDIEAKKDTSAFKAKLLTFVSKNELNAVFLAIKKHYETFENDGARDMFREVEKYNDCVAMEFLKGNIDSEKVSTERFAILTQLVKNINLYF